MPEYTKEYLSGSAKTIEFSNGGEIINVSFKESELPKFRKSKAKNGETYLQFTLSKRDGVDQFGNSHSLQVSKLVGEDTGSNDTKESEKKDDDWS